MLAENRPSGLHPGNSACNPLPFSLNFASQSLAVCALGPIGVQPCKLGHVEVPPCMRDCKPQVDGTFRGLSSLLLQFSRQPQYPLAIEAGSE